MLLPSWNVTATHISDIGNREAKKIKDGGIRQLEFRKSLSKPVVNRVD